MVVALGVALAMLAYLVLAFSHKPTSEGEKTRPTPTESVKPVGDHLIQIQTGHVIEQKLQTSTVRKSRIELPLMTVTGTVAASLRPGTDQGMAIWQFNAPDILTTYTDWQKAQNDVVFTSKQLATVRELVDAKVKYQKEYEDHVVKAGSRGSIADQTIAKARLDTIEARLDGQKQLYEAENAVRVAMRSESSLALQLEQEGLEPGLLKTATPDMDIVVADVPVAGLSQVKVGQQCKATFFGVRGQVFGGKVTKIVPVISKERRSLRVLFVIHDPEDLLRPGMFAQIDLGTDERDALLAPAEGVIHIGRADYFLVAAETPGVWRVAEVQIGEPYNSDVEILDGLHAGDRVLGSGAILLKPVVVRSLQMRGTFPAETVP